MTKVRETVAIIAYLYWYGTKINRRTIRAEREWRRKHPRRTS